MRRTASAGSIAEARADNSGGESSIRRRVGDGDVNLADVWPTITRVGAEPEAGRGWRVRVAPPGRVRVVPLKLDRPIVRVLGVHDDGGVSRYQA